MGGVGASSRLFSEPSLLDLTCAREIILEVRSSQDYTLELNLPVLIHTTG